MTTEQINRVKEVIEKYDTFTPEERENVILEVIDFDDFTESDDEEIVALKHSFKEVYNDDLYALFEKQEDDGDE